jgi:hypothetical protein
MKMIIILIILLVISSDLALAQPPAPDTLWTRTYDFSRIDYGRRLALTDDGGYIIVGSDYEVHGGHQVILLKTDATGEEQWRRIFGGLGEEFGESVQPTSDSGYILTGYNSDTFCDFFVVKSDSIGRKQWLSICGEAFYEHSYDVDVLSNNCYIVTGWWEVVDDIELVFLTKLDSQGEPIWRHFYGATDNNYGLDIEKTPDGGFIIAGWSIINNGEDYQIYVVKTDSSGRRQWQRLYGGNNYEKSFAIDNTQDGGYIIAGYSYSFGGNSQLYLLKIDGEGDEIWHRIFGGAGNEEGYSVDATFDGGFIITGYTNSFGNDDQIFLLKTDSLGNEQWSKLLGGAEEDRAFCVRQCPDSSYILVGNTYSYGIEGADVYLVKIASENHLSIDIDNSAKIKTDKKPYRRKGRKVTRCD